MSFTILGITITTSMLAAASIVVHHLERDYNDWKSKKKSEKELKKQLSEKRKNKSILHDDT